MAFAAREEATGARSGQGHRPVHRRGHGGGEGRGGASVARHRGPSHGRHERRRRPLRLRQDVPPAGHQVGACDEEGGGLPLPLHGGGEGTHAQGGPRRLRQARRMRPAGDGQGRRPRHRQEHCRRRVGLQQLPRHRPGRHGPVQQDPGDGSGREGGRDRSVGPHHAVARRDGDGGQGDAASGHRPPPPHRRRHHVAHAHRRQDRARVPEERDDARPGRVAGRHGGLQPPRRQPQGRPRRRHPRDLRADARGALRRTGGAQVPHPGPGARQGTDH
mmetsp:Transcript_72514/g.170533  ORF Transcript_72514/g.170533 Transcript_72514/m.170533 type:complete len:274 (-) Transcript_72514:1027-1848(-)